MLAKGALTGAIDGGRGARPLAGGLAANSLAVLSDAAHMASDFVAFLISILAILLARRHATARLTFGYQRAEVLGAIASVLLIWGLTIYLVVMAVHRCAASLRASGGGTAGEGQPGRRQADSVGPPGSAAGGSRGGRGGTAAR